VGNSTHAEKEFTAHGACSEISDELRALCLRVKLSSLDTCGPPHSEALIATDVMALLSLDRYKNVILCSELAAAEAVQVRSSASRERSDPSAANEHEAAHVNRRGNGRPAVSQSARSALQTWRLRRVQEYIRVHISDAIRLADLASAAGLTRMYFAAQFRARTGVRPHEYVLRQRIARALVLLIVTQTKIADVGLSVGFSNQAHFTTVFRRHMGTTPHRWRLSQISEDWAGSGKATRRETSAHLSESQ
jgi:AraC-like DNA-binding protein